jgi:hypothetical protein
MDKDIIINCPMCGEPGACYSIPINEFHKSYWCLGCGFTSSDLMKESEIDIESIEEQMPELYKDIKKVDSEGRIWYPKITNIEDMGTVFVNGTSKDDWHWAAIKSIELTDEEKENPKFKDKKYKSDSKTLTNFGDDYLSALEFIGIV